MNAERCKRCVLLGVALLVSASSAWAQLEQVLEATGWTPERQAAMEQDPELTSKDQADLLRLADALARNPLLVCEQAKQRAGEGFFVPQLARVMVTRVSQPPEGQSLHACRVDWEGQPQQVYGAELPVAFLQTQLLPQPAELLCLQMSATRRLAIAWRWYPTEVHYPEINFGETVLASLGVNVAGLARFKDGAPLRAMESEPFYEVLSSMRHMGAHQLVRFGEGNLERFAQPWRQAPPSRLSAQVIQTARQGKYPIAPLFNDALQQRGEIYVLEGIARRCVAIELATSQGLARRFGVERYFEIELFTEDSQNLPLVFCVLELPDGFPQGDSIQIPVKLAGFSLKRWAYRTRQRSSSGTDKPQLAPLLIGRAPIMLVEPSAGNDSTGLLVGGAFALAVALVSWIVWRTAQQDAQHRLQVRARLMPADPVDAFPAGEPRKAHATDPSPSSDN